jgi:hypothetical protein
VPLAAAVVVDGITPQARARRVEMVVAVTKVVA